ncbi:hypothetical protein HanRHA438_Chr17g0819881 [Helianthus annuus]|nr:hypothetical protein HanPSC8_Chr17g0777151 [Helianthus annuus]KAJ0826928.1 hypothetical protein HanRHA438_Chr17g0819881 [Helianthus annuus]
MVFSSKDSTIIDEDIDRIIAKEESLPKKKRIKNSKLLEYGLD